MGTYTEPVFTDRTLYRRYRGALRRGGDRRFRRAGPVDNTDNTLAYIDQASFVALRALERGPVIQFTWIYDDGVDLDGLLELCRNLGHTILGRRLERSPLPFGRHRWVAGGGPGGIDVMAAECTREAVWDWVNARAEVPVDPETGPVWHLGVQPLVGGGDAVTLVVSHTVADAGGIIVSVAEAVEGVAGVAPSLGYPPPGTRSRRKALRQDLQAVARTIAEVPSAVVGSIRIAREQKDDLADSAKSASPTLHQAEAAAIVPALSVTVDLEEFDRTVSDLGGTRNALFAAIAARLGQRVGRVDPSGKAMLSFPVSERVDGDTRGNALNTITVTVDSASVAGDLTGLRADLKAALVQMAETRDATMAPLPLTPFVPQFLVRRLEKMVLKVGTPIGCSNLGELPAALNRPDGADASYFMPRMVEPGVTATDFALRGGHMMLGIAFLDGTVCLSVSSWAVGGREDTNSPVSLAQSVAQSFADFGLIAKIEW